MLDEAEVELLERRPAAQHPRTWLVVLSAVLFVGLPCVATGFASSKESPHVRGVRPASPAFVSELGQIIQADTAELRLPAKSCVDSEKQWEPLNMDGEDRHHEDTLEKCRTRCRQTGGCAKFTYWTDGGCHLADEDAKLVTAGYKPREAVAGEASCRTETVCFKHSSSYEPLDMAGRGRTHQDSAAKCQELCAGMPHCETFVWWPDGGCHVQDKNSKAIEAVSKLISGPRECPLANTPAPDTPEPTPAPTPAPTAKPTPAPTAAPTLAPSTPKPTPAPSPPASLPKPVVTTPKPVVLTPAPTLAPTPAPTPRPTPAPTPRPTPAPTSAPPSMGCGKGEEVIISSHRSHGLENHDGNIKLSHGGSHDRRKTWILEDAGHDEVFLTNAQTGMHLNAEKNVLSMSSNKGVAAKWMITNAGLGKVFIQRQQGSFLQDFNGHLKLTPNADEWEKWSITTVDGEQECKFPAVKLYCFSVMRSWGHSLELMKRQHELGAGIFGCDESLVLSDAVKSLGDGYDSVAISDELLDEPAAMYKNSDMFLKAWQKVKHEGKYKHADWVIKTDPDTVFLSNRLRARLGGPVHSRTHSTFFANCAANVDVQAKEHPHFMYGPLEVYSAKAVDTFFIHADDCKSKIGLGGSMWEERYITHCLESVGTEMNTHLNLNLLEDPHCENSHVTPDCTGTAVAFHNFSSVEAYNKCWTAATSP